MTDRTHFLMFGRRFHNLFQSAINNGMGGDPGKWKAQLPVFRHHACGMFLSGSIAYLESTYGPSPWSDTATSSFSKFLTSNPSSPGKCFATRGISLDLIEALVCIRNAYIHNDSDLALNRDQQCISTVAAVNVPGVHLNGTKFELTDESMEITRLLVVAVAQYHGDG
jgi:hypothetical protein